MVVLIVHSRFFFHNDPVSRTTVIDPYTFLSRIPFVFFANTASCAKILANPASRVAVKSVSHQEILLFPESRAIFLSNPDHSPFLATCRKVFDKNRLHFKASRLRIRQSNRKREIETRCHLSR